MYGSRYRRFPAQLKVGAEVRSGIGMSVGLPTVDYFSQHDTDLGGA